MNKEYLYVGHYIDTEGNYILKIGTTSNLSRRQIEHTRNYKKPSSSFQMSKDGRFVYDWFIPLSKYNTLRYEDINRSRWRDENFGDYVRNDRFCCRRKPERVMITIRKTYEIFL